VYISDGTSTTTSVEETKELSRCEDNLSVKLSTKSRLPLMSGWNINGNAYATTTARWKAAQEAGIENHLVCLNEKINLCHHEIPEKISKCQADNDLQYDLPYHINFPIPQISDKNTRKEMCSARIKICKTVNKHRDINFIFSITSAIKHKLSLPNFQVKESSSDMWDFNPGGVIDDAKISSYRQLLKDCVACVVGTFLWASFYQSLHNHSRSFLAAKRLIVFHYSEKCEKSKDRVTRGDAVTIKPFRDFLLNHCGWLIITKENKNKINCNLELGTVVYQIKPIFYDVNHQSL
jgi:hypothetical protein